LKFVFIELPKFNKQASELQGNTDTWLFLLKHLFTLKAPPPEIRGRIFNRFFELAEINKLTHTEMETFEKSLKKNFYLRDMAQVNRMEEKMQIAVNLLLMNIPIDKVVSATKLSEEQVLQLQEDLPELQTE
jgi:hypothetical protein